MFIYGLLIHWLQCEDINIGALYLYFIPNALCKRENFILFKEVVLLYCQVRAFIEHNSQIVQSRDEVHELVRKVSRGSCGSGGSGGHVPSWRMVVPSSVATNVRQHALACMKSFTVVMWQVNLILCELFSDLQQLVGTDGPLKPTAHHFAPSAPEMPNFLDASMRGEVWSFLS